MFGAICSGRPMQLAQQVEATKFVVAIPNASKVNHLAIFLLPQTEFTDPSYTALVYFQLPNLTEFKLLGGLNPLKPSAIFKLNTGESISNIEDDDLMNDSDPSDSQVLNIGISIETTPNAEVLLEQEKQKQKILMPANNSVPTVPAPQAPQDIASLANKIVAHAYNYLGGFVDSAGKVPIKQFDNWWLKFRTKLANNPSFLNELD